MFTLILEVCLFSKWTLQNCSALVLNSAVTSRTETTEDITVIQVAFAQQVSLCQKTKYVVLYK